MKRGAIVLTKFPVTDLSSAKRRPGIVVSASLNDTNDVIIAFISSVIQWLRGTQIIILPRSILIFRARA